MLASWLCVMLAVVAAADRTAQASATDARVDSRVTRTLQRASSVEVILHFPADGPVTTVSPASSSDWIADRRIAVQGQLAAVLPKLHGKSFSGELEITRRFELQPAVAATVTSTGLDRLLTIPSLRYVEEDSRWPLHTLEGLHVIKADVLHFYGITGDDTAVAIIDTGVDYSHPTLGGGSIPNAKVVRGLDTADQDDDPMDCSGHGTAVASVAAGASYQWSPVSGFHGGVAPDARVFAYKASHDQECSSLVVSAVVAAIEDAVMHRNGPDYELAAINISAGAGSYLGPCDSEFSSYAQAVDLATAAGVAVVASAGNEGNTNALSAPACLSNVISVASVWDTDAGLTGFSFCLDPECSETCNDSFKPAKSVTCYSNSSPYLDVLAPSEYLMTAHAGGQTTSFGGTSGAAPYVTGSVALLRDAHADLDPVHARFLLALRGTPVFDERNHREKPLVDLAAALDGRSLALSDDTNLPFSAQPGSVLRSLNHVDDEGLVGFIKVWVKLSHPDPSSLQVRLVAPDGTVVILHDRGAGTTSSPNGEERFAGIFAAYPDSTAPVQSLDFFANKSLRGDWVLEIETVSGAPAQAGRLIGWVMQYAAKVPPDPGSSSTLFFPVTARTAGAHDTFWKSDLLLFNPSATRSATVRLYIVPAKTDGELEFQQRDLDLPMSTVVDLPDFIARQFQLEEFQGQLIVQSDAPVVTSSRIFNSGTGAGSYGQHVGATTAELGIEVGDPELVLVHLASSEEYRTNVGFSELSGSRAWVELKLINGDSRVSLAQAAVFSVEPFSNLQINDVFAELKAPSSENAVATVRVTAGSGRITAYASVVDNRTGDAMFIPSGHPEARSSWVVPVVACLAGIAGTDWVSDLRVYNHGATDTPLEMTYRPRGEGEEKSLVRAVSVGAKRSLQLDDVLRNLFGLEGSSGSLRVTVPSHAVPLVVSSRTYNRTEVGTFGQHIPAVSHGLGDRAVLVHLSASSDFRTNLGVCEVSGAGVELELTLVGDRGHLLGREVTVSLGAWELVQINDVHSVFGAPASVRSVVHVRRVSGSGEFTGYTSVVDAVTGDAVFTPAVQFGN